MSFDEVAAIAESCARGAPRRSPPAPPPTPRSSTPAPTAPRCDARRSRSRRRSRRMTTARAGWRRRRCPTHCGRRAPRVDPPSNSSSAAVSPQRRVDFREFMKLASTLLVMQVPSAPPASSSPPPPSTCSSVKELQLLQPPAARLFLAARPLRDAGLPPLAPQRCRRSWCPARSAVAWALLLPNSCGLVLSLFASPAGASGGPRRGARRRRRRRSRLGGARRTSRRGGAERATVGGGGAAGGGGGTCRSGCATGGHERGRIILAIRSHTGLLPPPQPLRARRRRPSRRRPAGRRPRAPSSPTTARR